MLESDESQTHHVISGLGCPSTTTSKRAVRPCTARIGCRPVTNSGSDAAATTRRHHVTASLDVLCPQIIPRVSYLFLTKTQRIAMWQNFLFLKYNLPLGSLTLTLRDPLEGRLSPASLTAKMRNSYSRSSMRPETLNIV